jgi:hypothetical protein
MNVIFDDMKCESVEEFTNQLRELKKKRNAYNEAKRKYDWCEYGVNLFLQTSHDGCKPYSKEDIYYTLRYGGDRFWCKFALEEFRILKNRVPSIKTKHQNVLVGKLWIDLQSS